MPTTVDFSKYLPIFLILVAATFLRFYNLAETNLWVDEPYHLYVADALQKDGSFNLPSGELYDRAKPFAYSTVVSTKIFGLNEFGIRFPSAFFGVISIFILFVFTKKLIGRNEALITAFLMAVIPFQIGWSRISRFYTLFQLLTIIYWFWFYKGFELSNQKLKEHSKSKKNLVFDLISKWNLNWIYLLLAGIVIALASSVQVIGVFLLVSCFVYVVLNALILTVTSDFRTVLSSKYFILSVLGFAATFIGYFLIPQVNQFISYGLSYVPAWARVGTSQDRLLYFKMIMGKGLFPIGALFLLGFIQSFLRYNKAVFYTGCLFIVQVFLFTFVFSYRIDQYIYNVFPFFVIVASYAASNLLKSEQGSIQLNLDVIRRIWPRLTNFAPKFVGFIFICTLPITEFFTEGVTIPFIRGGQANGAVTFLEWQNAAEYVKNEGQPDAIVLTTLPLTIQYYLGRVDFNLNLTDFDLAKEKSLFDQNNQLFDFYAGVPFIESVEKLEILIQNHTSGVIIVDTYRLLQDQYIPIPIRNYLRDNLDESYVTPYQTIRIYSWNHQN